MGIGDLEERIELDSGGPRKQADTHEVPLADLFPPSFMDRYTEHESIGEFFEQSAWDVDSQTDFEEIPADELDRHVAARTVFTTWEAMTSRAGEEWATKELGP